MRSLIFLSLILPVALPVIAQQSVGIGTNNPAASALLDIKSSTKGLLIPSMTTLQRFNIASPANGLLLYDTDKNGFYHYNGSTWVAILNSEYWSRPITSRSRIANTSDSVGIGTVSPTEWLDVDGNVRVRNNLLADGLVKGSYLYSSGNLFAVGTAFINGSLSTNADITINNAAATIQLQSSAVNKGFFQLAGDNVRLGTNSGNGTGNLVVRMNGSDRVFVDETGKVGVGVSTPTEKLDVAGNINFNGKITSDQTGGSPLTPLCWGVTNSGGSGGIRRATANVSVTRTNTGRYKLVCPGITAASVVIIGSSWPGLVTSWSYAAADEISVATYTGTEIAGSFNYFDASFSFVIY